jgi:hypothetical protein
MRVFAICVLALCAVVAYAEPRSRYLEVTTNSKTGALERTMTDTTIVGYIDEIRFECPTANTVTADVSIVAVTTYSTNVVLAGKVNCTADFTARPRFDCTGTNDTSYLTSDAPERYMTIGDTITMIVTNCNSTSVVWKALIKYDR